MVVKVKEATAVTAVSHQDSDVLTKELEEGDLEK